MSNGQSRSKGYRPEVRTSYHRPGLHCGQIVDSEWRPIEYATRQDQSGVPNGYFDKKLAEHGLLSFASAQAIRWWFVANAEAERAAGALSLETRLQKYELVIDHKVTPGDAISALDCRGQEIEPKKAPDA
jgi:hypothetical protein